VQHEGLCAEHIVGQLDLPVHAGKIVVRVLRFTALRQWVRLAHGGKDILSMLRRFKPPGSPDTALPMVFTGRAHQATSRENAGGFLGAMTARPDTPAVAAHLPVAADELADDISALHCHLSS